jgi:hypothetical protein
MEAQVAAVGEVALPVAEMAATSEAAAAAEGNVVAGGREVVTQAEAVAAVAVAAVKGERRAPVACNHAAFLSPRE